MTYIIKDDGKTYRQVFLEETLFTFQQEQLG